MKTKCYALLMMGGSGTRFGASLPKQFTDINGKPLFTYIARALSRLDFLDGIVIVVNGLFLDFTKEWVGNLGIGKVVAIVPGGENRSCSVYNGLKALDGVAADDDVVLMHDATHPYVDVAGTEEVVRMVRGFGSATLGSLIYDTAYRMDGDSNLVNVEQRRELVVGASPEGFKYRQIYDIYANTPSEKMEMMTSVGAIALANNIPMKIVPTKVLNLKITYPEDMDLFLRLQKEGYFFHE